MEIVFVIASEYYLKLKKKTCNFGVAFLSLLCRQHVPKFIQFARQKNDITRSAIVFHCFDFQAQCSIPHWLCKDEFECSATGATRKLEHKCQALGIQFAGQRPNFCPWYNFICLAVGAPTKNFGFLFKFATRRVFDVPLFIIFPQRMQRYAIQIDTFSANVNVEGARFGLTSRMRFDSNDIYLRPFENSNSYGAHNTPLLLLAYNFCACMRGDTVSTTACVGAHKYRCCLVKFQ